MPDERIVSTTGVRATRWERDGEEYVVVSFPMAGALPSSFTAAERDVCELLLAGCSSAEIARHRGTSKRTVANQCAGIYRKVGVRSRAELKARLA